MFLRVCVCVGGGHGVHGEMAEGVNWRVSRETKREGWTEGGGWRVVKTPTLKLIKKR